MKRVKCNFCGEMIDIEDVVKVKGLNYHPNCAKLKEKRGELCEYICKVHNLKSPGPAIYRQIKSYISENGFTYNGILLTLKYYYEILGNKVEDKYRGTIGIVPYVYYAAEDYYKKQKALITAQNNQVAALKHSVEKGKIDQQVSIPTKIILKPIKGEKKFIDLNKVIEDADG